MGIWDSTTTAASDAWSWYTYGWSEGWKELTGGDPSTTVGQSLQSAEGAISTTVNETATTVSNAAENIFDVVTTPIRTMYNDAKSAASGFTQTTQLVIVGSVVIVALILLTKTGRKAVSSYATNMGKMTDAGVKVAAKVL